MLSDGLTMNQDAARAPCPIQAKRKNLSLAWADQREAGRGTETNNRSHTSRAELKAPLQWA